MTIQITRPEVEALINQRLLTGAFRDAEDVIMQALQSTEPPVPAGKPDERTGADLIAALQSSPHRELEIEPPRYREPILVRDVVL